MSNDDLIDISNIEIIDFKNKPARAAKEIAAPPKKPPPPPDGGEPSGDGHDDDGLDGIIKSLNEQFALILMGSHAVIMRFARDAPIEDRVRIISVEAFKVYHLNRGSVVSKRRRLEDGSWSTQKVYLQWAPLWLANKNRRSYDGVEFYPDPANIQGTPRYFNTWRGLSCIPSTLPAIDRKLKYKTFYDHLLTNMCSGNEELFNWVFAWFAHMLQRPRERVGTAIVLRGKMGSGKTKIGEVIGSLFPSHYFLVGDPRYLTGNFNAHMASCLLLQVDEVFWAGDKAAEGRLKGLITAPFQMIEAKGIDPIRLKNYVRLLFSSNEDWVIPAGKDERRFCVIDIADQCVQNFEYFSEIDHEIDNGGREALLADLLAYELDAPGAPNLRVIPKTEALREQKIRSLGPIESWWLERLHDGTTTRRGAAWQKSITANTLFDDYVHMAEKIGIRRKSDKISFIIKLRSLIPLTRKQKTLPVDLLDGTTIMQRQWCYNLPDLSECRIQFEKLMRQKIEWDEPNDDDSPTGEEYEF